MDFRSKNLENSGLRVGSEAQIMPRLISTAVHIQSVKPFPDHHMLVEVPVELGKRVGRTFGQLTGSVPGMCDTEPDPVDTENSTDDDQTAHGKDCYQSNSLADRYLDTPKSRHREEVDDEVKGEIVSTGGDQGGKFRNAFAVWAEDIPVIADRA